MDKAGLQLASFYLVNALLKYTKTYINYHPVQLVHLNKYWQGR